MKNIIDDLVIKKLKISQLGVFKINDDKLPQFLKLLMKKNIILNTDFTLNECLHRLLNEQLDFLSLIVNFGYKNGYSNYFKSILQCKQQLPSMIK